MSIQVQNYQIEHGENLAKIFEKSILAIDDEIYSESQKFAWIGNHTDEFWQSRFEQTKPFAAVMDGVAVGFIEFDKAKGEIDCFYVEPTVQGQGVGQALFEKVLNVAKENYVTQINVNVSYIAKPFFEKQGVRTVQKKSVERSGVILENWLMIFSLNRL